MYISMRHIDIYRISRHGTVYISLILPFDYITAEITGFITSFDDIY